VGFSVALATQMRQVREARETIRKLPVPPQRILIGGPALRMGLTPDPSFQFDVCRNLAEVPILLGGSSLLGVDADGDETDGAQS
jgi:hypothetical protein